MSRGAGKIEQAITKSFFLSAGKSFTVEDLFYITYPEALKIERKHRVSINRKWQSVFPPLYLSNSKDIANDTVKCLPQSQAIIPLLGGAGFIRCISASHDRETDAGTLYFH